MQIRFRIIPLALFALALAGVSCRLDAPIKEMSAARSAISRAVEVKAEKYAPDDLQKAKDQLLASHLAVKNDKASQARESADASLQFANDAISKSLPLLSKDSLDAAKKKIDEARSLADPSAPSPERADAERKHQQASQLHAESKFWESYLVSKEIAPALDITLQKQAEDLKQTAAQKLEAARNELKRCRESAPPDAPAKDLDEAASHIEKAQASFASVAYRDSIASSDQAMKILNAVTIAMEKKREAAKIETEQAREKALEKKPGEKPRTYKVRYNPRKRDCLWRIALKVYKDPRLWPLIYVANKDKIKDPDLIYPGQVFIIPPIPSKKELKSEPSKDGDVNDDGDDDDDDDVDDVDGADSDDDDDPDDDDTDESGASNKPSDAPSGTDSPKKADSPSPDGEKKNADADAPEKPAEKKSAE